MIIIKLHGNECCTVSNFCLVNTYACFYYSTFQSWISSLSPPTKSSQSSWVRLGERVSVGNTKAQLWSPFEAAVHFASWNPICLARQQLASLPGSIQSPRCCSAISLAQLMSGLGSGSSEHKTNSLREDSTQTYRTTKKLTTQRNVQVYNVSIRCELYCNSVTLFDTS